MNDPARGVLGTTTRRAPEFFGRVRERARRQWNQLDADPELAGPWKQLFAQVQSPRHVLSELLQNADDVGARQAWVSIADGHFVFEHDGQDFDEEQFASLCRFGFSNKRSLHTIGFRGVGFKSTFSLGDAVEVLTPSLAVRFCRGRFTEPIWAEGAPPSSLTRIAVKIQDTNREKELRKNLEEWTGSPVSLLFFNSIRELTIGEVCLRKDAAGPGPVAGSERVKLSGCGEHDLVIFRSSEEALPDEAIREIRRERDTEDLHLPPCRVELVVGLPSEQRLYVVLPTGVSVRLPFSCNAPFLQDPSRMAIKAPSISPTNRWLLRRLGKLAGNALRDWLGSEALALDVRADAYCLVPEKAAEGDSLGADATSAICDGFFEATHEAALLLTGGGRLMTKEDCIVPPLEAYSVWTPSELLEVFGDEEKHVLAEMVAEQSRRRLESWELLDCPDTDALISRLSGGRPVPRPATHERLSMLWRLAQEAIRNDYRYLYNADRRRLALVPVEGLAVLLPADHAVRLSSKKETISDESWSFLVSLVRIIDRRWLDHLGKASAEDASVEASRQLLRDLNLERPSDVNEVVGNACRSLFARTEVPRRDCVHIAHVIAALDARTPSEFQCVTRDGKCRKPSDGLVAALEPHREALLPPEWSESHILHDDYFRESASCAKREWQAWVASPKSGFAPFAVISEKNTLYWSRNEVERLIESRQAERPWSYPYVRSSFKFYDFDFDDCLLAYWQGKADDAPDVWARVLERVVLAPDWYWRDRTHAKLRQLGYTYERDVSCGPIPSAWIARFAALPCLPDTHGTLRVPAELYLRTPETEPLMGVEPFVRAELDTEATKPLLRLLGVRDTPAGLDKLLDRIRALAGAASPLPLLHEITKWYGALDRVLARCDSEGLEQARGAFRGERLILTASGEWATSAEVFQRAGEDDLPDAPVIHPSVQDFAAWVRLGVAERPSAELVLDWLSTLRPGEPLDPAAVRRVRSALQRYPVHVWETCRHWLALDNAWTPVDELRFRLTMRGLTKWGDLFPVVKSRTANLQMLSAEVCDRQPFSSLPDLGASIEYRLTETPRGLHPPLEKPWLIAVGRELQRVRLADESETQRIRQTAVRLAHSAWQSFDDHDAVRVTPYVDGAPAGQPHSPDVLWHEDTIFVTDGRLARSFDSLVAELARPFTNDLVTEALKACIERSEDFIVEYVQEHFNLEARVLSPPPEVVKHRTPSETEEEVAGSKGEMEVEPAVAAPDDDMQSGPAEETAETTALHEDARTGPNGHATSSPPRPRTVSLFKRYALAAGYRWDEARQRFVRTDGFWIEQCEGPFRWRQFDAAGTVVTSYWASEQCLTRGVEIAAELWELVRGNPGGCCLVLVDENDCPRELPGRELTRMLEDGVVTLYPAKYRIREDSEV